MGPAGSLSHILKATTEAQENKGKHTKTRQDLHLELAHCHLYFILLAKASHMAKLKVNGLWKYTLLLWKKLQSHTTRLKLQGEERNWNQWFRLP